MGGFGRGRTRLDSDPDNDGSESPLLVLSVSEETRRIDGRPADIASFDQVTNLGTDNVPDTVQTSVEDAAERLDGDSSESTSRLGEWCSVEIGAIDEVWMVIVTFITSDTAIVSSPFVIARDMLEDNSRLRSGWNEQSQGR